MGLATLLLLGQTGFFILIQCAGCALTSSLLSVEGSDSPWVLCS